MNNRDRGNRETSSSDEVWARKRYVKRGKPASSYKPGQAISKLASSLYVKPKGRRAESGSRSTAFHAVTPVTRTRLPRSSLFPAELKCETYRGYHWRAVVRDTRMKPRPRDRPGVAPLRRNASPVTTPGFFLAIDRSLSPFRSLSPNEDERTGNDREEPVETATKGWRARKREELFHQARRGPAATPSGTE